jgi:hypothetical protein
LGEYPTVLLLLFEQGVKGIQVYLDLLVLVWGRGRFVTFFPADRVIRGVVDRLC